MSKVGGWVLEGNVRPFIDILASLVNYDLDEGEWDYIRYGLDDTDSDAEPPAWMRLRLAGSEAIDFRIAREGGTSIVMVELSVPSALIDRVQLILDLLSSYYLTTAKRSVET
ncbi:MAG: hypothetical protein AAF290_00100 [Pseudomonadota bacterium]